MAERDPWEKLRRQVEGRQSRAIQNRIDATAKVTQAQIRFLMALGVPQDKAAQFSRVEAAKRIDELKQHRDRKRQ